MHIGATSLTESSEHHLQNVVLDKKLDFNLPINNAHHPWKTCCACSTSNAWAYLGQGGKASSEGTSMYMYPPPRG